MLKLPKNSRMKLFGDKFVRYKTRNGQLAVEKYHEIANKNGIAVMLIIERNNEIEFIYSNKWYDLSLWMNC